MSEQQNDDGAVPATVSHRPTRGDPPRQHRFAPGVSGNPRGRPKGSKNFATLLRQQLECKVKVTVDGRSVTMTKKEAMVTRLVNGGLKGDLKFIEAVLRYSGDAETRPDVLPPMDADPERDRQILEAFLRRIEEGGGDAGTA